jgi:hypothetical protein
LCAAAAVAAAVEWAKVGSFHASFNLVLLVSPGLFAPQFEVLQFNFLFFSVS